MKFPSLKFWLIPLLSRLQKGFIALSMLDGKPALSVKDFQLVVGQVVKVQESYKKSTGTEKAKAVGAWVFEQFGHLIDEYFIPALVSKAYDFAATKGILPPSS